MAPKDRAEWLLRDFPASTPDERQAKAALVHIVRDAIAAAEAAERERCARLLERVARRLRADPGLNLWSCAADEVDATVGAIREGREP